MNDQKEYYIKKSMSKLRCDPVNISNVSVHRHHHFHNHEEHNDSFTDSEDINTPDVVETTISAHNHASGFKASNSLSRMSSTDSLSDYLPFHTNSIQQQNHQQIHSHSNNHYHLQSSISQGSHYKQNSSDQYHRSSIMSSTALHTILPPPPLLLHVPSHPTTKCRQLPCRTFISTGSCPYGDRCVFLHDAGILSRPVHIKCKRKSKEDMCVDAFFWPTMSMASVMHRTDGRNLPLITQPYVVPSPLTSSHQTSNNDLAVYSMWEHFLDFCQCDDLSVVPISRKVPLLNPYAVLNAYTGRKRLSVFVTMSQQ